MGKNDNPVLENRLKTNPDPSDLQTFINSAVQSQSKDQIALIARHIRQRLSSPISVDTLIEAIDNHKKDPPDDLKDLLGNQNFWKLRDILNKLISSEETKHLLPKGRIALSKNLLGILDELEEKHYFILGEDNLTVLENFFKIKKFIIDQDGIGPKRINTKIMGLLKDNPDELTPGFLRACVAFVMASKPYGSNKSLGKQRTIDKLDNSDQQVISGITKLVNSRIKGILETAEASEESYNDRDTKSRLKTLLAGKEFVAIEKMLRSLIYLKPEATDASLRSDENGLIDEINAASDILKSLNASRAKIREETTPTPTPAPAAVSLLPFLQGNHEQAS
jgi:hypothetical protein